MILQLKLKTVFENLSPKEGVMKVKIISALLLFVVIVFATPKTISFQGKLLEGGVLVDGTRNIHFYLYDVETGGSSIWDENHIGVTVADGLFNVELGGATSFESEGLDFSDQYWLTFSVSGGAEISPRYKLNAAPYAITDGDWVIDGDYLIPDGPVGDSIRVSTVPDATYGFYADMEDAYYSGYFKNTTDEHLGHGGVSGEVEYTGSALDGAVYGGHFEARSTTMEAYGLKALVRNTVSGHSTGGFFDVLNSGSSSSYGIESQVIHYSSTTPAFGLKSYVENNSSVSSSGTYGISSVVGMTNSSSTGPAYGGYFYANRITTSTNGDTYGVRAKADCGENAFGVYATTGDYADNQFPVCGFQEGYDEDDWTAGYTPGGFFGGEDGVIGISKVDGGSGVIGSVQLDGSGYGFGVYSVVSGGTEQYGVHATASGGVNNYAIYGAAYGGTGRNLAGCFAGDGYFSGDVGIGTTDPDYKLHVENEVTSHSSSESPTIYARVTDGSNTITGVLAGFDGYDGLYASTTIPNGFGVSGRTSGGGGRGVSGYASGDGMINYGVYGFATGATTNYGVYCSGDGAYTGSWTDVSDRKFKKNIESMDGILPRIMALNPVTFEMRTDEFDYMGFSEGTKYGLIAQELQTVFPELVKPGAHPIGDSRDRFIEYQGVDYIPLTAILIKAVQEQQALIEAQQEQIKTQAEEMNEFRRRIEALEKNR